MSNEIIVLSEEYDAALIERKVNIEVISANIKNISGNIYIIGQVQNNSEKDYSYIQVEFSIYDYNGALIDCAMDNISNLKSGKVWNFRALVNESYMTSFGAGEITAF